MTEVGRGYGGLEERGGRPLLDDWLGWSPQGRFWPACSARSRARASSKRWMATSASIRASRSACMALSRSSALPLGHLAQGEGAGDGVRQGEEEQQEQERRPRERQHLPAAAAPVQFLDAVQQVLSFGVGHGVHP